MSQKIGLSPKTKVHEPRHIPQDPAVDGTTVKMNNEKKKHHFVHARKASSDRN